MILIIGKSGTGKSTMANALKEKGLKELQSYTTRPPRYPGEKGHIFVPDELFSLLVDKCAYTNFNGYSYCATKSQIEENDVYVIDPDGYDLLKYNYKGDKEFEVIYLKCGVFTRMKRMLKRGDTLKKVISRLWHDHKAFRRFELSVAETVLNINTDYYSLEDYANTFALFNTYMKIRDLYNNYDKSEINKERVLLP